MSRSINKTILIGRLGNKPELKEVDSLVYTTFKLCNTVFNNGKEVVEWHNIKAVGKQAKICCQYLNKGDLCCIEGKMDRYSDDKKEYDSVIAERVTFLSAIKKEQSVSEK